MALEPSSSHEFAVHLEQMGRLDRSHGVGAVYCAGHCVDVSQDLLRRNVTWSPVKLARYLCVEEPSATYLEAFDF